MIAASLLKVEKTRQNRAFCRVFNGRASSESDSDIELPLLLCCVCAMRLLKREGACLPMP
jgi:hypothetical protein